MPRPKPAFLVSMSCLAVFLSQLGMMMYLPALPSIAQALNTTQHLTSLALPVYLAGMALPMLLWGKWGAAFGIQRIIMLSLLLFSISSALLSLCTQIETFISLRFAQGLGASGISVMARSLIAQHFKGSELAKALSWLSIAFVISLGIGQYAGAVLMSAFGWPVIFWGLGAAALILMIGVYAYLPDSPQVIHTPVRWRHYLTLVRHRPFLLPALIGGLGYGIIIGFNTAAPSIFQNTYQWSAYDYGQLGWAMSLAYLLGSLSVNRYVTGLGQSTMSRVAIRMMLAASAVMIAGVWISSTTALLLWLPYGLVICGQAIIYPISLSQASEHSPVGGPYAMALCGFIHQVLAALIGAAVSVLGVQQPEALAGICLLLVVMVVGVKIMQSRI